MNILGLIFVSVLVSVCINEYFLFYGCFYKSVIICIGDCLY